VLIVGGVLAFCLVLSGEAAWAAFRPRPPAASAPRVDAAFASPRLAAVYDAVNGERGDLDVYAEIAAELGARSVVDVGCGTGELCCRLAAAGLYVIGIDPASASLEVARSKPGAGQVDWLCGSATDLPPAGVDMAVMTGNVAQVFLHDEHWAAALRAIHAALRPGGRLVFETRDPARQAWLEWNRAESLRRYPAPGGGQVTVWIDRTVVYGAVVSFRGTYEFSSDGAVLTSSSMLRFRTREEVATSLAVAGFTVDDVRDAPDRPGKEMVFIATRAD
jgi:SAM-dependent methyltransferase